MLNSSKKGKSMEFLWLSQNDVEFRVKLNAFKGGWNMEIDYGEIIKSMPVGYAHHRVILDESRKPIDYEYIEINDSFERQTGLKREDVIGKRITEIIPNITESEFDWIAFFGQVAMSGEPQDREEYSEPLERWYKTSAVCPKIGEFIAYVTDVTEDKRELEEKMSVLMASNDIVFELDESYRYIDVIAEDEDTLFAPRGDFLGKRADEVLTGDLGKRMILALDRVRGNHSNKETMVYKSIIDGDNRWFYSEIRWTKRRRKNVFVISVHNITKEKLLEEELEGFFDVNLDLLCIADLDGHFIKVNKSWEEVLGYSKSDIEGKLFLEYVHPDDKKDTLGAIGELGDGKSVMNFVNRYISKDGNYKHIEWRSNFKDGKIYAAARDISDKIETEKKIRQSEKMFKTVVDSLPVRIFWKDVNLKYLGCNKPFSEDAGLNSPKDIVGLDDYDMSWSEYADDYRRDDRAVIDTGESKIGFEEPVVDSEGNYLWVRTSKIILENEGNEKIGVMGVFEDITDRKELELKLQVEKEFLKTTLLSIGDGVISIDCDYSVGIINKTAENLTGWNSAEANGKLIMDILKLYEIDDTNRRIPLNKYNDKILTEIREGLIRSRDGQEYIVEYRVTAIKDSEGIEKGAIVVFRDISARVEKQEKIMYLSYHDQLTGVYNRRFFEEELKRLDQPRNLPISIIMVDVNGLKLTNDAFGHMAGDNLLKGVSNVLKRSCRADDIIARVGGDEFAIILPKSSKDDAKVIVDRIYCESSKENLDPIVVSASAGYGTKENSSESIEKALKRSEDEMYKKKLNESKAMREKTLNRILDKFFEEDLLGREHSELVSNNMGLFGKVMGFDSEDITSLEELGKVHDIGLIALDMDIINKSQPLNEKEFEEVKRHPELGYQILKSVNRLVPLAEYVLSHHERIDGKGYPDGLKGDKIPLESRMLAIADAYSAMISERPYRDAKSKYEAIEELRLNAGTQFDEELIEVFIREVLKDK